MMAFNLWTRLGSPSLAHLQTELFSLVTVSLLQLSNRYFFAFANQDAVYFFA